MMRRVYGALIGLYPRDYVTSFRAEMLNAFERVAEERRAQGRGAYARFVLAELGGLAIGCALEWLAKFTTDSAVRGRCLPDLRRMRPAGVPRELWFAGAPERAASDELMEAQRCVDFCLRSMEHAIATHDFPGARFYSNEDLKAREKLNSLRAKCELSE
jgi:hypothetical protein